LRLFSFIGADLLLDMLKQMLERSQVTAYLIDLRLTRRLLMGGVPKILRVRQHHLPQTLGCCAITIILFLIGDRGMWTTHVFSHTLSR